MMTGNPYKDWERVEKAEGGVQNNIKQLRFENITFENMEKLCPEP